MYQAQRPDDESHSLVPLESLRRRGLASPQVDGELLAAVAGRLEQFAAGLTDSEQAALSVLLEAASPGAGLAALTAEPAEAALEPGEIEIVDRLLTGSAPGSTAGRRSTLVLVMKATRRCNLRCTYCHSWREGPNQTMTFEVLARATHGALQAPGVKIVEFVWHGGETTLLPLSFFRKAIWLQQRFRQPGQKVANALQTNGTNLTPEWLDFCRRYRFSLGISLDGPPEIHDRRRIDAAGRPTSQRVREALADVQASGLEHGVLMVIDDDVADAGAGAVLGHLLEIGAENVGLLNVIPENTPPGTPRTGSHIVWPRFVDFLRDLFRLWWPAHADRISFRELADLMGKIQGRPARSCVFDGNCMGGFLTVEPMGEVSACDKYLEAEGYRFGHLLESSLPDLLAAPALARAWTETSDGIDLARQCPWFQVCQGGCPHDRYLRRQLGLSRDESCCGLAPLLSDMAEALARCPSRSNARSEGPLLREPKGGPRVGQKEGGREAGAEGDEGLSASPEAPRAGVHPGSGDAHLQAGRRVGRGKARGLRQGPSPAGAGRVGLDPDPGPSRPSSRDGRSRRDRRA